MTCIRTHLRTAAFGLLAFCAAAAAAPVLAQPSTLSGVVVWDGAPPIGGAWLAHPDVVDPREVIVTGPDGRETRARLLPLSPGAPHSGLVVSGEVAQALRLVAGQPSRISMREPGPQDDPILARVATAMAELVASGVGETPAADGRPSVAAAGPVAVSAISPDAEAPPDPALRPDVELEAASPSPGAAGAAPGPAATLIAPPAARPADSRTEPPTRPGAGPEIATAPVERVDAPGSGGTSVLPAPRPAATALAPSASPQPRPRPEDSPARRPEAA